MILVIVIVLALVTYYSIVKPGDEELDHAVVPAQAVAGGCGAIVGRLILIVLLLLAVTAVLPFLLPQG